MWNPPFVDERDRNQGRVSTIAEASRIFRFLMERGVRAIVFCKVRLDLKLANSSGVDGLQQVRMQCEILMKQVRADLMLDGRSDMAARVMAYRSGYSAAVSSHDYFALMLELSVRTLRTGARSSRRCSAASSSA